MTTANQEPGRQCRPHGERERTVRTAFAATGAGLDDLVAPRFGECPFFLILDRGTSSLQAVRSPDTHNHGAGMLSAQLMEERRVGTVIAGDCGPYAANLLDAAGIKVVCGIRGTVREAVNRLASRGTVFINTLSRQRQRG